MNEIYVYVVNVEELNEVNIEHSDEFFRQHGEKQTLEDFQSNFNDSDSLSVISMIRFIDEYDRSEKDSDINDIMCTALEGGITYWVETALPKDLDYKGKKYAHEILTAGGTLMIVEEGGGDPHELTLEKFLTGLNMWKKENNVHIVDPGDIDVDGADSIVQLALFGEIVYS